MSTGSWYDRVILARILDRGMTGVDPLRAPLLAHAHGRVIEIGFGTGANLPHYPDAVTSLVAVEPNEGLAVHARERLARWNRPHDVIVQSGSRPLPFPDASFDTAVITFVLCSAHRVPELLTETRRLLRPGGPLLLAEHIAAHTRPLRWLQRFVRPAWKTCLGGCDPTLDPRGALIDAGFDVSQLEELELDMPIVVRPGLLGVAR
jgi:ubiquinone/menaquinone biosynthesis C-methylase UbiE